MLETLASPVGNPARVITPDTAVNATASAIEGAAGAKVSDAGREWLRSWYTAGKNHAKERRSALLAESAGAVLVHRLTKRIRTEVRVANLLKACLAFDRDGLVGVQTLRALEHMLSIYIDVPPTRLCNDDPPPDPEDSLMTRSIR